LLEPWLLKHGVISYVYTNTQAYKHTYTVSHNINALRTGDADLRFYITTVQDG